MVAGWPARRTCSKAQVQGRLGLILGKSSTVAIGAFPTAAAQSRMRCPCLFARPDVRSVGARAAYCIRLCASAPQAGSEIEARLTLVATG